MKRFLLAAAVTLLGAGCAARIAPPESAAAGSRPPDAAWAEVLSRFVDDAGRIDFTGLAKSPSDLDATLAWIARVSPASDPGSFPTPQSKLAYYVNAYNAIAMYDVIRSSFPPDLNAVKVRFFYKNRFQVGGEYISLYALENKVIRPMGDPRIHFALNCMARGCPRLPREPFRADELDAQLEREANEFFREERNVQLDPSAATVRLSQILEFYTEDFLKAAPSLIEYVNRYRDEKIPAGWKVGFIPYDWTLNQR